MELLRIRQKELKNARLAPGEEEELAKERDRFRNVEKIEDGLREAYDAVYNGTDPAVEALRTAVSALGPIEGLDERYASVIVQRYVDLVGSGADVSVIRYGQTLTYDEVMAQNQT